MNRFFLSLILSLFISVAFSQRVYFVYLQNESAQPFYVKLNGKTLNSGKEGYLVVPKLVDSTYEFSIGSSDSKLVEQKFAIKINAQDHGYLLKGLDDKSWGLFDLQNLSVIRPSLSVAAGPKETKQVSAFTDVLSRAANDPTLKEKPIEIIKEEKPVASIVKEDTPVTVPPVVVQQEIKKDTVSISSPAIVKTQEVKQELPPVIINENNTAKEDTPPVTIEQAYQKSNVIRRSESSTTEGLGLVFIDQSATGASDTIRLVIPNTAFSTPLQTTPAITTPAQKKDDQRFLNIESDPSASSSSSRALRKNDCTAIATESDFLKLRKKMAAEIKADAMLTEARKGFKAKCYTVAQVKNLGTLFLEEEGRYRFFDEAFTHVSDKENFSSLVSELKQEYYINRFNAMLK